MWSSLAPVLSASAGSFPMAVETLIAGIAALAAVVFVAAYRYALREATTPREHCYHPQIPRAEVHASSDERWAEGAGRQRALSGVRFVQAGFVAFGITSVFIMFLCMAGIVGLMLLGS